MMQMLPQRQRPPAAQLRLARLVPLALLRLELLVRLAQPVRQQLVANTN
jgi:hypothetical protein